MNDYRSDLKAYLDGELTPERAREVEAALATDPALREEVEFMKVLGLEIQRIKHDPEVRGAAAAMGAVRRRPGSWWLKNRWVWGTGLTALFVLVMLPTYQQAKFRVVNDSASSTVGTDIGRAEATKSDKFVDGEGNVNLPKEPQVTGGLSFSGKLKTLPGEGRTPSKGLSSSHFAGNTPGTFARSYTDDDKAVADPTVKAPATSFGLTQKLVRTADLSLRVASAKEAQSQAIRIITGAGGFVAASNLTGSKDTAATATVTLRVPVRTFDMTLEALRKLGDVISDTSNTEDVTAQVADTDARLKVMRAEEDSYVTMLRAAKKVGELLEIKERLSSVRQEIESLTAQKKALNDHSSYSTITATFEEKPKVGEPEPPKDWSSEVWANAVNGLAGVGRFLASAGIFLFVYAPIWLPVVIIGWVMVKRGRKGA